MSVKSIINKIGPMLLLALSFSCSREMDLPVEDKPEVRTIHYKAQVGNPSLTRATVDEGNHYIFEESDRLYVAYETSPEKLYGVLYLVAGAGTTSAWFEGDLYCEEGFEYTDETSIKGTLVNAQDKIHTCGNGRVSATEYPSSEYAPDFATAVKYYSDFTATSTFGSHSFNLSQNSTFLIFNIRSSAEDVPGNTSVSATFENAGNTLRSATVTAQEAGRLSFVTAFPGGSVTLSGAKLSLSWGNQTKEFTNISNQTLSANTYYNISRSTVEYKGFRIIATEDYTNVHFNYTGNGIQYSLDMGSIWTDYNTESDINLNAGEAVCFKGQKTNYKNAKNDTYGTPNNKPVFTADKKVYIAGHIMSLLVGEEYSDNTPMPVDAFNGAFSTGSDNTYIDIDPADPLILPVTLNTRCYKNMFRRCQALTNGPTLKASGLEEDCYEGIFRGCTAMTSLTIYLNTYTGDGSTYESTQYQRDLLKNNLDKWFYDDGNINTQSGTLRCPAHMVPYWNNSKYNSGPWYKDQFATLPQNWSVEPITP